MSGNSKQPMNLSLIFTTYNSPDWLQKVLWSVQLQQHRNFEVIIADDGSTDVTRALIDAMRPEFEQANIPLHHVWQSDNGFRKCRILNKAIVKAQHDYIVFTDGDCVLRKDFLSEHVINAEPGHYLSGTYFKLPLSISQAIDKNSIVSQACFDRKWLQNHGLKRGAGWLKLTHSQRLAQWANRWTPTACNLKGANASAWKADILAVGGMDERMPSGGQDREFGVRLQNSGIIAKHVRFNAVCLHLHHERGYRDNTIVAANRKHRLQVAQQGVKHTTFGTDQFLTPETEV